MSKKLFDLEIPDSVAAIKGRGIMNIKIFNCMSCGQDDASKISVISEMEDKIKHALAPDAGTDGIIYGLECDVCHHRFKFGVIKVEGKTASGPVEACSIFCADTEDKWKWLGCY
nr:hypothetical protein [Candidatus Sigynarchaeota archaeon]